MVTPSVFSGGQNSIVRLGMMECKYRHGDWEIVKLFVGQQCEADWTSVMASTFTSSLIKTSSSVKVSLSDSRWSNKEEKWKSNKRGKVHIQWNSLIGTWMSMDHKLILAIRFIVLKPKIIQFHHITQVLQDRWFLICKVLFYPFLARHVQTLSTETCAFSTLQ